MSGKLPIQLRKKETSQGKNECGSYSTLGVTGLTLVEDERMSSHTVLQITVLSQHQKSKNKKIKNKKNRGATLTIRFHL